MSVSGEGQEGMNERTSDETVAVISAARLVGLPIAPKDLAAVTAHLSLLLGFAAVVADPAPEPAPVFRP